MVTLHNFVVRPVTLCVHVHSTAAYISGNDGHSLRNILVVDTFKCPIEKKRSYSKKLGPLHYFSVLYIPSPYPNLNLRHFL